MSTGFLFTVGNVFDAPVRLTVSYYNCLDLDYMNHQEFWNGTPLIVPPTTVGPQFSFQMFKRSGHGCDGDQGRFTIEVELQQDPSTWIRIGNQAFDYDGDGRINLSGTPGVANYPDGDFASVLTQPRTAATAFWWVGEVREVSNAEKLALITKHCPKIWFAKYEQFMPCNLDWAFNSMTRVVREGNYWLYTKEEMGSPTDDSLALFKGDLQFAQMYAFIVDKAGGHFDVSYFVFFPYNKGKMGFGNHVGDWEHITVRFHNALEPYAVYCSAHDGGSVRNWKDVEKDGDHPVIYSASGAHAFYFDAGAHVYSTVLTDTTSQGSLWWPNMMTLAFDYNRKVGLNGAGWPTWMSTDYANPGPNPNDPRSGAIYRWGNGRWGLPIAGQYPLEDGPTGPIDKGACWDPNQFG